MQRKFLLFIAIIVSAVMFSACSSSLDGISGKVNKVDNSSNNGNGNNPGDNGSGEGNSGGGSNDPSGKFDDQVKESDVNDDFTNPMNFVGRYKILSLTVQSNDGSTVFSQSYAEDVFKGNLGVDVDLANITKPIVNISLKYQFHPTIVAERPVVERFEFLSKRLDSKFANLADANGDIMNIFKKLGADIVEGNKVQFTLTNIDVPVNPNEKMIILLEKVGNKARHELIADGKRYWNSDGSETDRPDVPTDNETTTPPDNGSDDVIIPDEPVEGVTPIDFNNLATLKGHYEFVEFTSQATALGIKETVASTDQSRVQKMKGELSINTTADKAKAISKMQMDSTYLDSMKQSDDKYNYTIYTDFSISGSGLKNSKSDRIDSYKGSTSLIKITQTFKKDVSYPISTTADVSVTVIARKISDTPKNIPNKPYWGAGSGESDPEKPILTPIDFNGNPSSIEGNYKVSNICYYYKRPAGGLEDICATNPTAIQKLVGDLAIKYDNGVATNSYVTSKTQLKASWFTTPLFHEYNDPRWLFLYENNTKNYSVSQTEKANQVKITFRRVLKYRTGVNPWWTNHNINVDINIWAEKVSDEYKEVNGSKFF